MRSRIDLLNQMKMFETVAIALQPSEFLFVTSVRWPDFQQDDACTIYRQLNHSEVLLFDGRLTWLGPSQEA